MSQYMPSMGSMGSMAQGAQQMMQKMPDMQKMMGYGQNLYGLAQEGYGTFCAFQPNNPQC